MKLWEGREFCLLNIFLCSNYDNEKSQFFFILKLKLNSKRDFWLNSFFLLHKCRSSARYRYCFWQLLRKIRN